MQPSTLEDKRARGEAAELEFCKIAAARGLAAHRVQQGREGSAVYQDAAGRSHPLPDVLVFGGGGSSMHEVKIKDATSYGTVGLETYRVDALLALAAASGQTVWYTVLTPDGRWRSCEIEVFASAVEARLDGPSLVGGAMRAVEIQYASLACFVDTRAALGDSHP